VLLSGKTLDIRAVSGRDLAVDGALALTALSGCVGIFGAVRWWTYAPSREFWFGVRAAQALAFAYAAVAGILYLDGVRASGGLYYLYALLPIAVGFVAEQLRLVAADQVLAARDLEDAQEVGTLPEEEQHAVVLAIMRREIGVMTLASLVICFLALRAASTF
jgi:hypothetical protein